MDTSHEVILDLIVETTMVPEVLTEMGTAGMVLEMVTVVLVVMVVAMAVVEWVNR